jgi:hypothetical protein
MSRFAPALRRVAGELDLPAGVRGAIVLEMAADLEAVYEHHRRHGLEEAEAAARAEEMVLGSTEVARRLGRLHRDSWRSWPHRPVLPRRLDLLLLLAAVLPITALSGVVALGAAAASAGPFLWPLLAIGVAMVAVTAVEAGRLLGARPALGSGLHPLPVLAVVAAVLGLLAFVLETRAMAVALAAGAGGGTELLASVDGVGKGGALFLVGLLLGIGGAVAWFILIHRTAASAAREVDALLASGGPPPAGVPLPDILPLRRRHS